jgi:predicted MFS family arabinose efflux permease
MSTNAIHTPAPFTPYQKLAIAILALTQFTVILDFMIMSPLGDALMKSMELTTVQFGIAVSAYALSAGASGLLTAGFADRYDRKNLLLFFYIGFIVGTFFCGITTSYPMLIAARIITGLFGGVIGSISMAIMADLFPLQQRGRVMGFIQMGFGASQVLGIPIGLYISNYLGWQAPFFMIVGLAILILFVIVLKLKPINEHLKYPQQRNAFLHMWHTIKQRDYRVGFTATALMSLGGFMMMPWGSAFSINNLHITTEQLPLLFMIAGIGSLIVMPIIGRLSDSMDKFILFAGASFFLMGVVVYYTHLTPSPFWVVTLVNVLMMVGVMSRMVPSMALTSALPDIQDRGAFMSINSSLQQMAGGVAAFIGGLIVVQKDNYSPLERYDILGYVIVGISVVCMFMLYRVSKLVKAKPASKIVAPAPAALDHVL